MAKFFVRDLRPDVCHRRGHGHRHGVRVRDELGGVLAVRGRRLRQRARGRRHLRLLPRVGVPRRCCSSAGTRSARGCTSFATVLVCLGAHFSAIWIVVANSWMQTPAGYHLVTDAAGRTRAEITDFWALVFNPSSVDRLIHTVLGRVVRRRLLRPVGRRLLPAQAAPRGVRPRDDDDRARPWRWWPRSARSLTGDWSAHGVVARHQPEKFAAMEGVMEASAPAGLHILGWVDEANRRVRRHRDPGAAELDGHRRRGQRPSRA